MKAVYVRYTVTPEFADTNAANIQTVIDALKANGSDGVRYQAFREADDVSFVHFGMYRDQAALDAMTDMPEFQAFQQALKTSGPVSPPRAEWLEIIDASKPVF